MGFVRSTGALLFGVAVGGALVLAYRISQETGKSFSEALTYVPDEAKKVFDDLRARAMDAMEMGREAGREKQEHRPPVASQPQ